MKSRNGKLFFIKQIKYISHIEGLYKCPLKVKSEFEPIQSMLSL